MMVFMFYQLSILDDEKSIFEKDKGTSIDNGEFVEDTPEPFISDSREG